MKIKKQKYIDIIKLQYTEPFIFKGGSKIYWYMGFSKDYSEILYNDRNNKMFKKNAFKQHLVKTDFE